MAWSCCPRVRNRCPGSCWDALSGSKSDGRPHETDSVLRMNPAISPDQVHTQAMVDPVVGRVFPLSRRRTNSFSGSLRLARSIAAYKKRQGGRRLPVQVREVTRFSKAGQSLRAKASRTCCRHGSGSARRSTSISRRVAASSLADGFERRPSHRAPATVLPRLCRRAVIRSNGLLTGSASTSIPASRNAAAYSWSACTANEFAVGTTSGHPNCSTLGTDFVKSPDKFQVGQCLPDPLLDFWRRLARGERRLCPPGRRQRLGPLLRLFEPRHFVQDQLKLPRYFRLPGCSLRANCSSRAARSRTAQPMEPTATRPPKPSDHRRQCQPCSAAQTCGSGRPPRAGRPPPARRAGSARCRPRSRWPFRSGGCGPSPGTSSRSSRARRGQSLLKLGRFDVPVGGDRRAASSLRAELRAGLGRLLFADDPQHFVERGCRAAALARTACCRSAVRRAARPANRCRCGCRRRAG